MLTERSTKKELLDAYNAAMQELNRLSAAGARKQREVAQVSDGSPSGFLQRLAETKAAAMSAFSSMASEVEAIVDLYEKIRQDKLAAEYELKVAYDIKAEADSLEALTMAKLAMREQTKEEAAKAKAELEAERLELTARLAREKEEAEGNIARLHREKKLLLEDALADRRRDHDRALEQEKFEIQKKTEILAQEKARLEGIEKESAELKASMDATVAKASQAAVAAALKDARHEFALREAAMKQEKEVLATLLSNATKEVERHRGELEAARAEVATANSRVQAIATSAVESASQKQSIETLQAAIANKSEASKR